jgi:hypothetical protein
MDRIDDYFSTARERYLIKLNREAGHEPPWTADPIFREWRFCNVHREDDKTTMWFKQNIRTQLQGEKLIAGTVIFRWFNRIETGEVIKDLILGDWSSKKAEKRLRNVRPIVTGAYMIRTPEGMNKLEGVLYYIDRALPVIGDMPLTSLEDAWKFLVDVKGLGPFLAYEIVTDLRWTHLLKKSPDIMTWANPGPGCVRGLGRAVSNNRKHFSPAMEDRRGKMLEIMAEILEMSRKNRHWPNDWPQWEMREVEHWACEFAKYCAGEDGKSLKRRYQ